MLQSVRSCQLGFGGEEQLSHAFLSGPSTLKSPSIGWRWISTLDEELDAALGGGIPPGYLVEITGER
jgi:DNA repair protein RAD57